MLFAALADHQRDAHDRLGRCQPRDGKFVAEGNEIEQPPIEQMRHPLPHALLRKHHMRRAGAGQNARMIVVGRLRPDIAQPQIAERQHRQDAGLYVGADRHHRRLEIGHTQLLQRGRIGAIGLHRLGEHAGKFLHQPGIEIGAEHFMPHPFQRCGHRPAEAAETDDQDRFAFLSRQWDSPPDIDRADHARPAPAPWPR